jgi:hypothetical protein
MGSAHTSIANSWTFDVPKDIPADRQESHFQTYLSDYCYAVRDTRVVTAKWYYVRLVHFTSLYPSFHSRIPKFGAVVSRADNPAFGAMPVSGATATITPKSK